MAKQSSIDFDSIDLGDPKSFEMGISGGVIKNDGPDDHQRMMEGLSFFMKLPRIFVVAISLVVAACTTNYSTLRATGSDDPTAELVIGDESEVVASIEEGIHKTFPAANVAKGADQSFSWYHQPLLDRTTYRLTLRSATGDSGDGKPVTGFYFVVDTSGTQGLVEVRYLNSLKEAIYQEYGRNGLALVRVQNVQESSAGANKGSLVSKVNACFVGITNDPSLAPLSNKVSLGSTTDQTFAMLTNNSRPSAKERTLINLWGQRREECMKLQEKANAAQRVAPQIRSLLNSYSTNLQTLIAQLYLGRLTYADFSSKRQAMTNTTNEAIVNVQAVLARQDAEAQARAEQLSMQATQNMIMALSAVNQGLQQQQTNNLIRQQNTLIQQQTIQSSAPVRLNTTCQFIGRTMFCN